MPAVKRFSRITDDPLLKASNLSRLKKIPLKPVYDWWQQNYLGAALDFLKKMACGTQRKH
jgi:hypothetical protein